MKDQIPYLIRRLREAGDKGVHTFDLRREGIGNPSQRVSELRELGFEIEGQREKRNDSTGSRYLLLREPGSAGAGSTAGESPVGASSTDPASADLSQLFVCEDPAKGLSHYDVERAA